MPKVLNDAVLKLGFDMAKYYRTEKAELPISGTITYAFLDPDYKNRAEPADILTALDGRK